MKKFIKFTDVDRGVTIVRVDTILNAYKEEEDEYTVISTADATYYTEESIEKIIEEIEACDE